MRGYITASLMTLAIVSSAFSSLSTNGETDRTIGENIIISWMEEDVHHLIINHNLELIRDVITPTNPYIFTTDGLEEGVYIIQILNPNDVILSEEMVYLSGGVEKTQLGDIYPSPNPFDISGGFGQMEFVNVPEGAIVRIYDFGGLLVDEFTAGSSAVWNGYNREGKLVASGPYIFYIEHGGETFIGKFAVVK